MSFGTMRHPRLAGDAAAAADLCGAVIKVVNPAILREHSVGLYNLRFARSNYSSPCRPRILDFSISIFVPEDLHVTSQ
jgi:hypothetical protein